MTPHEGVTLAAAPMAWENYPRRNKSDSTEINVPPGSTAIKTRGPINQLQFDPVLTADDD
ncbi:MAG: hypothetical protein QOE73_481 [Verrucomicrobiota bacterium]|jgi:hypothetical protein